MTSGSRTPAGAGDTGPDPSEWLQLLESGPFARFRIDRDGVVTHLSGAAVAEAGVDPAAIVGRPLTEVYPGNSDIQALVDAVRDGRTPPRTVDVVERVWELHAERLLDPDGAPAGAIGIAVNITSRQRASSALEERHELQRLIATLSTEFISLPLAEIDDGINTALAKIGAFVGVDRAFLFRRDPEPHPEHGRTMSETHEWCAEGIAPVIGVYQQAPESFSASLMAEMDGGRDFVLDLAEGAAVVTPQERQIYESEGVKSLVCVPIREDGATTRMLGLVTLRAVRPWSAEEVSLLRIVGEMIGNALHRQTLERSVEQRRGFEQLVATLAAEFINLPVEETDEGITRALRRIGEFAGVERTYVFEFTPEARTLSNTFEWCAPGITPQAERIQDVPYEAFPWALPILETGRDLHVPDTAALPDAAAQERAEFLAQGIKSLICTPLRRGGTTIGFLGCDAVHTARAWSPDELTHLHIAAEMFSNTIERRAAEQERRRLEQQVRQAQKLESLGVLAGGIAHDFNNLLTTMLGNASLALEDLPAESPVCHSIEQVRIAAERARDLTNQMLAYAGRGRVTVEALDLSAVVREMAELLRVSIGKRATLDFGLATDLPAIAADASQVRQVVMNLLTNAAEALEDGPGSVTVRTGVVTIGEAQIDGRWVPEDPAAGQYVFLSVVDTGSGMDAATRARIFDPFYSTKFAGRGLGLAAVLGIAQTHGGALRVESRPGQGTEFRVLWPVPTVVPDAPAPPKAAGVTPGLRDQGTVLVIDDEAGVRIVTRNALERAGFTVLAAPTGRQGVELFRMHADEIVAVILDLEMPEMDGVQTFGELRRVRNDAPVVLSSGYTERDATSRFSEAGLAGFLQKPYTASTLREAVRAVAGRPG